MSKPYLKCKAHFNQKDSTGVNKYNDISMYTFFTCIATDVNYSNYMYIQCILSLYNKNIQYPYTA